MEISEATAALAAIGQYHRLRVFKRLIEIAPNGLSAGEIARELDISAATLSTHLAKLRGSGLLRSWRDQRHIFYAVDVEGTRRLLDYLIYDCCRGHLDICEFASGDAQSDHDRSQSKPVDVLPTKVR